MSPLFIAACVAACVLLLVLVGSRDVRRVLDDFAESLRQDRPSNVFPLRGPVLIKTEEEFRRMFLPPHDDDAPDDPRDAA